MREAPLKHYRTTCIERTVRPILQEVLEDAPNSVGPPRLDAAPQMREGAGDEGSGEGDVEGQSRCSTGGSIRIGSASRPAELASYHSARRGAYRVVYRIDDSARMVVVVVAVDHRGDVYRSR